MYTAAWVILFCIVSENYCNAVSVLEQLQHIARRRQESGGLVDDYLAPNFRRSDFVYDPYSTSSIMGVPSMPSHLPEAEPILPGHTLLRPAFGMLKSAVKFPHVELENGFGVNGNINNIGIKWGQRNERVLYTGFRRMPADYVMISPSNTQIKSSKPNFDVTTVVLDLDKEDKALLKIAKALKKTKKPYKRNLIMMLSGDSELASRSNVGSNRINLLFFQISFNNVLGEKQTTNIFNIPQDQKEIINEIISLRKENKALFRFEKQLLKATRHVIKKNLILVLDDFSNGMRKLFQTKNYENVEHKEYILLKIFKNISLRRDDFNENSKKMIEEEYNGAIKKLIEENHSDGNETITVSESHSDETDYIHHKAPIDKIPSKPKPKIKDNSIIVIQDQNALDFDDLIPPSIQAEINAEIKPHQQWWFYNQDDFHEFTGDETTDTRKFLFKLKRVLGMLYDVIGRREFGNY